MRHRILVKVQLAAIHTQLRFFRGEKPAPAHRSLGNRIVIAAWEGEHFDVEEHAVFDVDRRDVAAVVGVDEEHAAAVPEVLAVFFTGFDVQFQSLSSHCLILILSVSMNTTNAGTKEMSVEILGREECAGAGEYSCWSGVHTASCTAARLCSAIRNTSLRNCLWLQQPDLISLDPEKTHLRTSQARPVSVQQVQPSLQRAIDRSKQRLWEILLKLVERGLNDRMRGLLQFFE